MLFIWILVLKTRESGGRLSYYHTFSNASGTQIKRKQRTSQLGFGYSRQEKVKNVSTIVILFLLLWVLKCGGRLSYYHTCSIALGAQIKRK